MTNAVLRPVPGPLLPAMPPLPQAGPKRPPPEVTPAFRIIPSLSPLTFDIGVLAETYARAAEKAEARRRATPPP
jgi:hypothetical protein